jgi:hypothetical protein
MMGYTHNTVLKKLRVCFPVPDVMAQAQALLDTYGGESWHKERDRVHLAILKLSAGELGRLHHYVEAAKQDYRDVLAWAEYPEQFRAPPGAPHEVIAPLLQRDRAQYLAWLESDAP